MEKEKNLLDKILKKKEWFRPMLRKWYLLRDVIKQNIEELKGVD